MSMAKDTKFRFGVHTYNESQDMNHEIFFLENWRDQCHVASHFWALNASNTKMAEATDFKFGKHAHRVSPNSQHHQKSARRQGHVTPKIFGS